MTTGKNIYNWRMLWNMRYKSESIDAATIVGARMHRLSLAYAPICINVRCGDVYAKDYR